MGNHLFIFSVPKRFLFVKQLHGAHFSTTWNLRGMIVDHLRTTYHMTCARISFLGTHAAFGGAPPNPLETDMIWTRAQLSNAPEIPDKMFLVLRRIIICANFCSFSLFANGCTRTPGTAIPHVPGALFWPDGFLNEVKKNPTEPGGVILYVIVTIPFVKTRIWQLFWKTLHEKSYHVRSSMDFRGNEVGNGLGMA